MVATMEPALDVLHRALSGDEGARSFLDRTSSIYVLDATDLSKPHTYGCWNFIHQAMNEVERAEGKQMVGLPFVPHAQLLATMALRVARRSNDLDKQLVATCIENAAKYHGTTSEAQRLIDINVEIRDIVMGRLAALALDPSFHRNSPKAPPFASAFSDAVVLETFCAVLAANAVSNGPAAVRHLVSDWIVPSSQHIPPFCLTCITLHLAEEASRKLAPVGIQDVLQQLSSLVMAGVLAPVLTAAIKEASPEHATSSQKAYLSHGQSIHEMNCRIAALSLRAINQWCAVTDLSLAQIKHICSKVGINIIDTINDAMYSDSRLVVDALAEFMESVMERHQVVTVSEQRMTQVRYIMQVDEDSFRTHITAEQLVAIESKEMALILEDLTSAIGLQRFRFADRQMNGDVEVCRNLARMGASICDACRGVSAEGRLVQIGPGLLDLLLKSAAHPSIDISGIAIDVLTEEISSETGLVHQLLPILQGRAITPHQFVGGQTPSILPQDDDDSDLAGLEGFHIFRNTSLTECLQACYAAQPEMYLSSCVAAIEEFCSPQAARQVSFHLEAALFCIGAVSKAALKSDIHGHMENCTAALALKPESLLSNPLTLSQACRFVEKYEEWFAFSQVDSVLDVAADLALSTFGLCASNFPYEEAPVEMKREGNVSPYTDAAKALRALLIRAPTHFLSNQAISALGAGWEASYAAANRTNILTLDDRVALCEGICHVLASLPQNQRGKSLLALAMPALDCLEAMMQHATNEVKGGRSDQLDAILDRMGSEIVMVTTMASSFSEAFCALEGYGGPSMQEPALTILQRAWPMIQKAAEHFNYRESIVDALECVLTKCIPSDVSNDVASSLLQELCQLGQLLVENRQPIKGEEWNFRPILSFAQTMAKLHGRAIDDYAKQSLRGENINESSTGDERSSDERTRQVGSALESIVLTAVEGVHDLLGPKWTNAQRQGNGQPAFESKSQPVDHGSFYVSNVALAPMLELLQTCAEHCPFFLVHLPTAKDQDRNEDLLVRRAIESAVSCILERDVATATRGMQFLEASIRVAAEQSSDHANASTPLQPLEELLRRVREEVLNSILIGVCGKFGTCTALNEASDLLHCLLQTYATNVDECRTTLLSVSALSNSHDHFWMGVQARSVILDGLFKCCRNQITAMQLRELTEAIWDLHHSDSIDALGDSDAVARFCQRFRSS